MVTISKMILPALCTIGGLQQDDEHTYWSTAAHCVPPVGQIVMIESPIPPHSPVEARVISRDAANDTAILKCWTKQVGKIQTQRVTEPTEGPARIETHRGTVPAIITADELAIRGLTPRQLALATVVPGDSGSPIMQRDNVVGIVSHSVDGCRTGFCPGTLAGNRAGGILDDFQRGIAADGVQQMQTISWRDIVLAAAGIVGATFYHRGKTPRPKE